MANIQRWVVTEPWLNIHCSLGEGPYYEPATNTLRFVDIIKRQLHTVGIAEGPRSLRTLQFDQPVGVTADIEGVDPSKKVLVGGKGGIYILERDTGKMELLKRFYDVQHKERDEGLRSNDGAVDPQGRFWVGTMNDFHVSPLRNEGMWDPYYRLGFLFFLKAASRPQRQYTNVFQRSREGFGSRGSLSIMKSTTSHRSKLTSPRYPLPLQQ